MACSRCSRACGCGGRGPTRSTPPPFPSRIVAMPALWTGSISFGLVTIPVSLVTAETREELDFTLLDRRDDSPLGYKRRPKQPGKPVPKVKNMRAFQYTD